MIAPHALSVLKLTLRCATIAITSTCTPQHVVKTIVLTCATILVTTSTLGVYDTMKNMLNWKVRSRPIMMAELRHKVMCHAVDGSWSRSFQVLDTSKLWTCPYRLSPLFPKLPSSLPHRSIERMQGFALLLLLSSPLSDITLYPPVCFALLFQPTNAT